MTAAALSYVVRTRAPLPAEDVAALLVLGMALVALMCVLSLVPPFLAWLWGGPDSADDDR